MTVGAWVLLAAVAATLGFGLHRVGTDGRFRATRALRETPASVRAGGEARKQNALDLVRSSGVVLEPGERATLLQFSSAFCAPCRATRQVLSGVADTEPGVVHLEIDAEQHLDLVRRLDVLRTPTTLILDADGFEVSRAAGAPTRLQVLGQVGAAG